MSDAWFIEKTAPYGAAQDPCYPNEDGYYQEEDGCHPHETQALKDYCHKSTSAKEAARAITRPIESSKDPGANLYRLWNLLIDALVELPASQVPALIQLLGAIEQLPEPDLTAEQKKPVHGALWRELSNFGHMWADEHKQDHWRRTLSAGDPASRADLRAKHVRKAEVEARLAVANVGGIPMGWGYECIADALERRDAVLDLEVPAAAMWIAIAGERLYAGAVNGEESLALERRRDFGKEAKRMSLERWSFWEKRMEEMLQESQATQDAAKAALSDMKALRPGSDVSG
jgi:Protein of unknown function (DUF3632)